MAGTLTLWGHALAALFYASLALWALRRPARHLPRTPLAGALALTALWSLSIAGIGAGDIVAELCEGLRNLAWLWFMIALHRRDRNVRPPAAIGTVYGSVALIIVATFALNLIGQSAGGGVYEKAIAAGLLFRMLVAVTALVLTQNLYAAIVQSGTPGARAIGFTLAGMWLIDLNLYTIAYLSGHLVPELAVVRGFAMALLAPGIALSLSRRPEWSVQLSRTVAYQSLSIVAIGVYLAVLALVTSAIAAVGGGHARILQTAAVFGLTATALTLASSPWLRAWFKVKLAKHFFRHRYDYRAEWMRFTETLGQPRDAAPLEERIVQAIADLTDSPAGLLLEREGDALTVAADWNWSNRPAPCDEAALVRYLAESGRILELDAIRAGTASEIDSAATPEWLRAAPEAWVVVPLPHLDQLKGAILLARPPLPRALDWEDFDLLKVAGRQVASYLAEARAQDALAEARRFDEFNRRFAFIMHDIKNLVSQLSLVARNAERHADNPEFRADMVATLQDSAGKMTDLLARLSQHSGNRPRMLAPVPLRPLLEAVAATRGRLHPISVAGDDALVLGDPAALEQMIGHLVQNAVEASTKEAPVNLTVTSIGDDVQVSIEDQGCGMSQAFIRDRLFRPFVSSKDGGFGIGAFEAQQLAAAMGGTIRVTSREGKGSRFTVTLKRAAAEMIGRAA